MVKLLLFLLVAATIKGADQPVLSCREIVSDTNHFALVSVSNLQQGVTYQMQRSKDDMVSWQNIGNPVLWTFPYSTGFVFQVFVPANTKQFFRVQLP